MPSRSPSPPPQIIIKEKKRNAQKKTEQKKGQKKCFQLPLEFEFRILFQNKAPLAWFVRKGPSTLQQVVLEQQFCQMHFRFETKTSSLALLGGNYVSMVRVFSHLTDSPPDFRQPMMLQSNWPKYLNISEELYLKCQVSSQGKLYRCPVN